MKKTIVTVGTVEIPLMERSFPSNNILRIKTGTSGQGHDNVLDCKTVFSIYDAACTNMRGHVIEDEVGNAESIQIILEGDSELVTFVCGLKFALDTLVEQIKQKSPEFDLEKCYEALTEYDVDENEISI